MQSIPVPGQLPLFSSEDDTPAKRCSRCQQCLPINQFYIKVKRTGQRKSHCKTCCGNATGAYRRTHLEQFAGYSHKHYHSDIEKHRAEAQRYREAHPDNVRATIQRWRESHPEYAADYRAAHVEQRDTYNKAYRDEHREERHTYSKQYYRAHREERLADQRQRRLDHAAEMAATAKRSKAKHKDRVITYNRAWRKENLALCNTYWSKRRARLKGNGGAHTPAEWAGILDRYGHRCLACGRMDVKLTKDHVIPVTQGGTDNVENLQPLCLPCNASKGDRTIDYR